MVTETPIRYNPQTEQFFNALDVWMADVRPGETMGHDIFCQEIVMAVNSYKALRTALSDLVEAVERSDAYAVKFLNIRTDGYCHAAELEAAKAVLNGGTG